MLTIIIRGNIIILVYLVAVGVLWGCTNPFIKLGSRGIEKINTGSSARDVWLELKTVALRLKYWVPFLINQFGSVLYVWTLQNCDIITAVPVCNSLTFAFTAITGYMLGEKTPGKSVLVGAALICVGSSLMLYDQITRETLKSSEVK